MNRTFLFLSMTAVLSLAAGCTATGNGYGAARPAVQDEPQPIEVIALAERIGSMPVGRSTGARTPVGEGVVRVTGTYVNALGEECRRVQVILESGEQKPAAACRSGSGTWRFVRPLR